MQAGRPTCRDFCTDYNVDCLGLLQLSVIMRDHLFTLCQSLNQPEDFIEWNSTAAYNHPWPEIFWYREQCSNKGKIKCLSHRQPGYNSGCPSRFLVVWLQMSVGQLHQYFWLSGDFFVLPGARTNKSLSADLEETLDSCVQLQWI